MKQLLINYRIEEIFLFIAVLLLALKQIISLKDWFGKRARQAIEEKDAPLEQLKEHDEEINQLKGDVKHINKKVDLLVKSDIDALRHSLTKDHHYFCYKLGSIDDYSLACMEAEYENYKAEGGNTFIDQLMEQVRALPRKLQQQNR